MQVSFERRGGFTGIPIEVTVNTAALSPEETAQLHRLVEAARFFDLPAQMNDLPQPDRFYYKVTVWQGDRQHTVRVGESAVPPPLYPLLDWLMEAARRE
ncbi:protealysin inhibitor emfourin [Egbenema bharatensis]|uniref:protealysin inhibitor emfourin n=1 Tax=Egbenema bharatensis TaxID=3463334 RepID=UPI003A851C05